MFANACLHELFTEQARRTPEREAVRDSRGGMSYHLLEQRANALASLLLSREPKPGARIGLHLKRSNDVVLAILATLKAGHTYVPLDPEYPSERLEFMAEDSALALVITDREVRGRLADLPVLRVDQFAPGPEDCAPPQAEVGPDTPAYVIYTSGSTGRPKGVVVTHRNVAAFLEDCHEVFDLRGDDVWALFHSYCFDFSVWEIWGAFTSGATLVVVPPEVAQAPESCLAFLAEHGVNVLNQVPSVFRYLARAASRRPAAPDLRYVIFGGEPVDVDSVRAWRRAYGTATRFVHAYGITETTVLATCHPMPDAELDAPEETEALAKNIGVPLRQWQILLLDEAGHEVPAGEVGEICIAGPGVAEGYLNRPELTAERFPWLDVAGYPRQRYYRSGDLARWLPDGNLQYAGRSDDQVKIHGFRIELGEIEAVLRRVPGVRDLAVVTATSRIGEPMLVAYYTAADGGAPADRELIAHARRFLPAHMIPVRFVFIPEMPLNPSGKTDRRALAETVR